MIFLVVIFSLVLLAFGFEMFLVLGVPALIVKELFFSSIPDTVIIQKWLEELITQLYLLFLFL